jgi:putative transposase
MVIPFSNGLSIVNQCKLLSISRSSLYYQTKGESSFNLDLMRLIDIQYLKTPFYGSRQMARHLRREGFCVGRKRIRRLMRLMGIEALYQKPRTSIANSEHKVYPYLLKNLEINRSNQVWCADITYIPMPSGFMYLVSVMDWSSRKVLSWRLSNTLDRDFCVDALKEAISRYGKPEIFNTDQGSQFTSTDFTEVLINAGITISMDGKGRWMDNIFIERLWRSLKYECVYLNLFETCRELKQGLTSWIDFYNENRPHSSLDGKTPNEVYYNYSSDYNLMNKNVA